MFHFSACGWIGAIVVGVLMPLTGARAEDAQAPVLPHIERANAVLEESVLALSPDGSWLAYTKGREVFVVRPNGTGSTSVPLPTPMSCSNLIWNSSGRWLAFVCQSPIASSPSLYVWKLGSKKIDAVVDHVGLKSPIEWLPGGERLIYAIINSDDHHEFSALTRPPEEKRAWAHLPSSEESVRCPALHHVLAGMQRRPLAAKCSSDVDFVQYDSAGVAPKSIPEKSSQRLSATVSEADTERVEIRQYSLASRRSSTVATVRDFRGDHRTLTDIRIEPNGRSLLVQSIVRSGTTARTPLYTKPGEMLKTPAHLRVRESFVQSRMVHCIDIAKDSGTHPLLDLTKDQEGGKKNLGGSVRTLRSGMTGSPYLEMSWDVSLDGRSVAWKNSKSVKLGPNQNYYVRPSLQTSDLLYVSRGVDIEPVQIVLDGKDTAEDPSLSHARLWVDPQLEGLPEAVKWTRDGRHVLVVALGAFWIVDPDAKRYQKIHSPVGTIITDILWYSDSEVLIATVDVASGRPGTGWVDFDSRRLSVTDTWGVAFPHTSTSQTAHTRSQLSVAKFKDGRAVTIAYVGSTISSPFNIFVRVANRRGQVIKPQRAITKIGLEVDLPHTEHIVIRYRVAPGRWAYGLLIRPAGTRRPLPAIVWAYPGNVTTTRSRYQLGAGEEFIDVFATLKRGYAVLFADVPMSDLGVYGERGPSAEIVEAMSRAVAEGVRTGWIDPERIGVSGHSYGGYMVNVLVARTRLFRAAVSMSGMANLVSAAAPHDYSPYFVEAQGRMGKTVSDAPDRYVLNSTIFDLGKADTPLLLIHGMNDYVYPVTQSEGMFTAMASAGKAVALERFRNDAHVPKDPWPWWVAALKWFDLHLKPD